jgi:large subunit ribosomal protein L18e
MRLALFWKELVLLKVNGMTKKLETVKLIASLEKAARKTKKSIWSDLAERLEAPTRHKPSINAAKLNEIAEKNKGKTIIVPGKVLSGGEFQEKAIIVAVSASAEAKRKINEKGKFIELKEFVLGAQKVKASELIIAK